MKKFIIIISSVLAALVVLIGVMSFFEEDVIVNDLETVVMSFENDETFLFVMGSSDCYACKSYKAGTLKKYVNEDQDLELVFAYTDQTFSRSTIEPFIEKYIKPNFEYRSSPTTYLVKDGEVVAQAVGDLPYSTLQEFIDDNQ
jgi:thioredoxin-like negative regulator of GroEL